MKPPGMLLPRHRVHVRLEKTMCIRPIGRFAVIVCLASVAAGAPVAGNERTSPSAVGPSPHRPGVLTDDGVAHATIVVPADSDTATEYAAADLQEVLGRITQVLLPISPDNEAISGNRILLGDTCFTDDVISAAERRTLDEEDYIVRLRGRDLALVGGGPYGVIYAVAELYDRLGARWYMSGELGECIPRMETVRFEELDVRRRPSFQMRWIGGSTEWKLRNRTNRIREKGLPSAFVVAPEIYHTQEALLPDKKYGETHPEYFALVDGGRSRDVHVRKLCNANPEVAGELAKNMAAVLKRTPGIDLISLSPTDGQQWCECPACRRLDDVLSPAGPEMTEDQRYSRRQLVLYNRVAAELEKEFPDQLILVGAYSKYTLPPRDPSLVPHRNLAVIVARFLPSLCCYTHAAGDPACPSNRRYVELIRKWQSYSSHIYFYEYYFKGSWLDLPWPLVGSVARDIPFFKSMGIEGISSQYSARNVWSHFLHQYVAARLLWDHTTDVPALLEEFYVKFFGRAAGPMKHYYELMESQMARCSVHNAGAGSGHGQLIFTPEVMADLERDIQEAQRLATDDLVKRRIGRMAVLTEYTGRLMHALRVKQKARRTKDIKLLGEAYALMAGIRDEILAPDKRGYYEGVIKGTQFGDKAAMTRWMNNWRREVIDAGLPDPATEKGAGTK